MKKHSARLYLMILAAAASLQLYSCGDGEAKNRSLSEKQQAVEVQLVKAIDGNIDIPYSGTIEESESAQLSFSVVGNVSKVLVSEGDRVSKGQLLAYINDATYRNALETMLAAEKQAEDAYNRLLPMYKNGSLQEIKFVEVETGLQQAKSAVSIARSSLNDCRLYAPISGVVGKRAIEPGMSSIPNMTYLTIINIDKVYAKVSVSEGEISSIARGEEAKVKIRALDNTEFTGKVEEIGIIADPVAHTYKVKIALNNKDRKLKPGMICDIKFSNKQADTTRLSVPNNAVLVDELGKNYVYVVSNGKATRKYIKTGKLLSEGVEVTEGLSSGEQVVVASQQRIVDNSSVQIVNR